jgi:hypothetical protein
MEINHTKVVVLSQDGNISETRLKNAVVDGEEIPIISQHITME